MQTCQLSPLSFSLLKETMMVWLDPKHQGRWLLSEERESREDCVENGEEALVAKSPYLIYDIWDQFLLISNF